MAKPTKDVFDPKEFLARLGGKAILEFHKNQHVFRQGDVADSVFYIQSGKVKLTVVSEQGKEAVVAILEPGQFFGRMHEWSSVTHRDDNSNGRLHHHVDNQRSNDGGYS